MVEAYTAKGFTQEVLLLDTLRLLNQYIDAGLLNERVFLFPAGHHRVAEPTKLVTEHGGTSIW